MAVIEYRRAQAPGTCRISRNDDGDVTISIAPDTAKRTIYTLTRPLANAVVFSLIPLGMLDSFEYRPVACILLAVIWSVAALASYRIVAASGRPIVFRAGVEGIHITNPIDAPPERFYGTADIIALEFRRTSLIAEPVCYALELRVRTARLPHTSRQTLLVSQCDEMLDRIGRTLGQSLALPAPEGDRNGWTSYRPPFHEHANATPASV